MSTVSVDISPNGRPDNGQPDHGLPGNRRPDDGHIENELARSVRLRPWRELALLSAIIMELSWVTLWYRLFIPAPQKVPYLAGLILVAGMLLAVYLQSRVMAFLDTKLSLRRIILFFIVTINLFLGLRALLFYNQPISLVELLNRPVRSFNDMANLIPPEFVTMFFVLVICWRGVSFADRHVGPVNVLASFRLGILMFFLYGLLLPAINESPNLALYIFLFFSLLTMSAARISVLSHLRGGQHIQFNRQWMLGITGIIAVMIGLSALAIAFTTHQLLGIFTLVFTWLVYLIVLILTPLLWIIVRFFIWLFGAIQIGDIFDGLRNVLLILENLLKDLIAWVSGLTSRFNLESVEIFLRYLAQYRSLYLWIILLIGLGVVLLTLRRYILKEDDVDEQEADPLATRQDLLNQLRNALRRGLGKLANNIEDILRFNQARRLLAAARIRRIYANLLNLSSRLDRPRHASQTPLEFLPSLEGLFPGLSNELGTITEAYLLVRYGELPETAQELEEVEVAWKQVSSAGQEQLKAKRRGSYG